MKLNVRQLLRDNLHPETIGKNKAGNLVLRWGYFYRNGRTSEHYVARVRDFLTNQGIAHVIGASGDHFAAFRGGASTANSSHFFVEIQLLGPERNCERAIRTDGGTDRGG